MVILRMKHNLRIFLRRHYPHQVKGSKVIPSSQPVKTSSPVGNSIAFRSKDVNGWVRILGSGKKRNAGQVVPHFGKGTQRNKMMKTPCLVNPTWGNTHTKMVFSALDGTAV